MKKQVSKFAFKWVNLYRYAVALAGVNVLKTKILRSTAGTPYELMNPVDP